MNTNAWGTLRGIQAVLPSMRERGSGHILNVTSVAGRLAVDDPAPPDRVAAVVWEALTASEPRLRYLVGDDAARFEPYRRSITDEEWIARQADADDDAWWAWIEGATGVGRPSA